MTTARANSSVWFPTLPLMMAAPEHITAEEFLDWYPMFSDVQPDWIDQLLTLCETAAFDPYVWGSWLKAGEALFMAHVLTMREMLFSAWSDDPNDPNASAWMRGVTATGVTDFSAGSVKWSKDATLQKAMMDAPFSRTLFGQEFMALRKHIAVGLVLVT